MKRVSLQEKLKVTQLLLLLLLFEGSSATENDGQNNINSFKEAPKSLSKFGPNFCPSLQQREKRSEGTHSPAGKDAGQGQASPPAVLYLPLGGSGRPSCLPSAGSKLAQLVPLMFAGMTFTIFDAVATVANNINSNNNNNNNDNINFQQSSNTVVTGNINVANQINVMNMVGRKKRAAQLARKALDLMSGLNQLATAENLHDLQKLAVQEGVKFLY